MVLSILAILSMVALTKVGGVASETKWRASERIVDDIAQAIVGDVYARDGVVRDGRREIVNTSFLSDVGRLPRAWPNPEWDPNDEERMRTLTLAELFVQPEDVLPFSWYPATTNYFAPGVSPKLADPAVRVPCGWRGPYLKMTSGDSELYLSDGWNAPFTARLNEFVDARGECTARILPADFGVWLNASGTVHVANGVMSNGFEIAFIRHLGDDRREEITMERIAEVRASPDAHLYRDYCVDLRSNVCARIEVNVNPPSTITPSQYGIALYGPRDGWIGAWAASNATPQVVLEGTNQIPIGRKVVRAWASDGTTSVTSDPKTVILPRSGCSLTIDIHGK